ncbi:MAG: hypothetical protein OWU33_09135 [Firmicutes bacterium]|nr:hypothetical protein [Bacillota bacterium]
MRARYPLGLPLSAAAVGPPVKLAPRYVLYFVLSFVATGLQSMIPQAYFEARSFGSGWLGGCLLSGALAAIILVRVLHWLGRTMSQRQVHRATALGWLIMGTTLLMELTPVPAAVFVGLYAICRSVGYGLLDIIDRSLVSSGRHDPHQHAVKAALAQIAGIVVAPVWFAYAGRSFVEGVVLAVICVGSWGFSRALGPVPHSPGERGPSAREPGGSALFLLYVIAVATLASLFAAGAVLIVRALYRPPEPVTHAGWLLAAMNVSAAMAAYLMGYLTRDMSVYAGAGFFLCTLWLWLGDERYGLLLAIGVGAGLCYGAFEVGARREATRRQRDGGDSRPLEVFNNAVNYATLAASLLLLGASWVARGSPVGTAQELRVILVALAGVAALSALAARVWQGGEP